MKWILTIIAFVTIIPLNAQNNSAALFKRNNISLTGNLLYGATLNYERIISEHQGKFYNSNILRIAGGMELGTGFDAVYMALLYQHFYGKKANHLEWVLGPTIAFKYRSFSANNLLILPVVNIGYRYQKPGKNFLFRTGIGFPQIVYAGLGVSFG